MTKKANVKVVHETPTGLNQKLSVNGVNMTNNKAYSEANKGNIPGFHGVLGNNGTKFIRSNPDKIKKNNLG